jgi:hypothetical protein
MAAQGIDEPRSLTNQTITNPMQHRGGLLIASLDRHETHR